MYIVFGDERHDSKQQRVYAVAGVFGSQEEWDNFESAWLVRTGGVIFHATDCEVNEWE